MDLRGRDGGDRRQHMYDGKCSMCALGRWLLFASGGLPMLALHSAAEPARSAPIAGLALCFGSRCCALPAAALWPACLVGIHVKQLSGVLGQVVAANPDLQEVDQAAAAPA